MNDLMTNGLSQTWVRVVDQLGRAHLEARWVAAPETPAHTPGHGAHAPASHGHAA